MPWVWAQCPACSRAFSEEYFEATPGDAERARVLARDRARQHIYSRHAAGQTNGGYRRGGTTYGGD